MAKANLLHNIRKTFRRRYAPFHPRYAGYKWWLLGTVMIGTFMAVLDSTIVNVGLPKIMASFGVGLDKIEWVLTAYMLAMAVMLPTSGWAADRYGYKKMYILSLLTFTLGSFLCGAANDENMLVLARIVQGLGGGSLMPIGMAIITREFPTEQRGIALGFWAISAAASVSFGPLIGGYLIDNFSWQLIFDVNVPVGVLAVLATFIIQREYMMKQQGKFDFIGIITASIFLPSLLYALSEGSAATNAEGWSAPYILFFFAIAFLSLTIFIFHELVTENPLMDLRLFGDFNFTLANIIRLFFSIGLFGSTFLLPLYLQNTLGYSAIQAGSVFLPVGIIQGVTSPLVGKVSDKSSPKVPIVVGMLILAVSFYMNSSLSLYTEKDFIMLSLYLRGFAMGLIFTPLSSITLINIPREKMGQASGLFNILRQLAGSFGVALFATIQTSRVKFHSQLYGEALNAISPQFKHTMYGLANHIGHVAGSSAATSIKQANALIFMHVNVESYISAINDNFLIAAVITIIGTIPVFWLKTKSKFTY